MRIASVNISDYGSTGRIMLQLSEAVRNSGNRAVSFSRNWWKHADAPDHCYFGYKTEHLMHHALGYLTGREGSFSYFSTADLVDRLREFQPDILHLHNLHGWYINLSLLFGYIKQSKVKVIWTLHDCWPFTGHCPYFDYVGCGKWTEGCRDCPQISGYPQSLPDNSAVMYEKKKECFTGVEDLTVVCPSHWLAELAGRSFLGGYDIRVIHNGIDTSVFRRIPSEFRSSHGIKEEDKLILGVASGWEERKGIDVFPVIRDVLGSGYRIVLVGVGGESRHGLDGIIPIGLTSDQEELAEIYSAADVFVNPTREDNYPTVNLEAISCGTPVVTFDSGGSAETIPPGCGISVAKDDTAAMTDAIITVCGDSPRFQKACIASADSLSMGNMISQYLSLYEEVINR